MDGMVDVSKPSLPAPDAAAAERFRALMLPHLDAVYGFARWLTRDPVVAQDVAQEAMLRALRYLHAFRGGEPRPWLLGIVRNTWTDMRAKGLGAGGRGEKPLEEIESRPADGPDPEQEALSGDRRRHVAAALAALPAEAREILVLREVEDLAYKEISSVLGLPIGTVMSRLARAREKLAAELRGRLGRRDHGLPDL
ncbi:MAG TPA: sigma-70 family RNA polymerase sigma factor [Reyranella sp.]|jgi:RNA polymerase sigma-70 factor (ECF subfamily)|nr:sigma-70 family RNA polymerase sigma factor [Reyranella sp.]